MSYLDLDNVRPSAGGTYRNLPRGVAAAWDFYDQAILSVSQSVNISSVTDNSSGNADHNFTNSLNAIEFPASVNNAFSSTEPGVFVKADSTAKTNVITNSGSGLVDRRVNFLQFGDLA